MRGGRWLHGQISIKLSTGRYHECFDLPNSSPKAGVKEELNIHFSMPIPHWARKMEKLIPNKQIPSYCWFIHSRLTKSAGIWSMRLLLIRLFHIQSNALLFSVKVPPPLNQQGAGEQCLCKTNCTSEIRVSQTEELPELQPWHQQRQTSQAGDSEKSLWKMKMVRIYGVGGQNTLSDRALNWQKKVTKAAWHVMVQLTCGGAESSYSLHIFNWPNSRLSTVPLVGYGKAVWCQHLWARRRIGVFPNTSWHPPPGSPGCLCPFPVGVLHGALPSFPHCITGQRDSGKTEALKAVSQPAGLEVLTKSSGLDEGVLAEED